MFDIMWRQIVHELKLRLQTFHWTPDACTNCLHNLNSCRFDNDIEMMLLLQLAFEYFGA